MDSRWDTLTGYKVVGPRIPILERLYLVPCDFVWGVLSRFPLCCVFAYCIDKSRGVRWVALYRQQVDGDSTDLGYVPCVRCSRGHR